MSKGTLEKKLEALAGLTGLEELRKALADRNNFYVSKAAARVTALGLRDLVPELERAFERFLRDDPQCWAKNAIVKALKDLEHREPAVYLRGMAHVQMEPVWGGRQDTAATLRGACALALVDCRLPDSEILERLLELLVDPEKPVRVDAARAIAQVGSTEGDLLLRLKALAGDGEPEVTGACLRPLPVPFVARFLDHADAEVRMEAAAVLGEARDEQAVEILQQYWRKARDPRILTCLGASPVPGAAEFLLSVAEAESGSVRAAAVRALAASRFREEMRERVRAAVSQALFDKEYR